MMKDTAKHIIVFGTIFIFIFLILFTLPVYAEMPVGTVIGEVLSTDIVATIDHRPIPSFNYNNYTAIIVEDLRSYGFDVRWKPAERKLEVTRIPLREVVGKSGVNTEHVEPGIKLHQVLHTDIKTYVNGSEVESYNIDGLTVIYFNVLSDQGTLEWNQGARMASLYLEKPAEEKQPNTSSAQLAQNEKQNSERQTTGVPVTRQKTTIDPDERFLRHGDYHPSMIPDHVKIGLFFNQRAVPSIEIKSPNGFQAGFYESDQFQQIFLLDEINKITLNKDSHYYASLQQSYQTLSRASNKMGVIGDLSDQELLYASLDDEWSIYAGPFFNRKQTEDAIDKLTNQTGESWTLIQPSDKRVNVVASNNTIMTYLTNNPLYFASASGDYEKSIIQIGAKKYRGAATATRQNNSDLTVINLLPMEMYLYGVVPREMPHSWPEEALKAQAVAARGFAVASLKKYAEFGFNFCSTVHSQVYGGFEAEQSSTNRAVDLTKGQIITYNGHLAIPYYHSSSGGRTESSENIWTNSVPYIRGVSDEYSLNSPHTEWEVALEKEEIESILKKNQYQIGELENLYVAEISENGRVLSFMVEGADGKKELIKQESRSLLGLRSSWFEVEYDDANETYFFNGKGYGHGIGMSQFGAKGMAEEGYRYKDILKHYYTGVRIQ